MSNEEKLATQATQILYKYGQKGLDAARKAAAQQPVPHQPLRDAVEYFMATFEDVLHPALLGLACEAVGGKLDDTIDLGAALVLLAGSADLHDDIIDGSTTKDGKPTVYGKFGKDLTVLAGDALLFEGLYFLHEACERYPSSQKKQVLQLVKEAFFKLSSVEARDAALQGKTDQADQYLEMIMAKSAVTEATMKIGVIIGQGTAQEATALEGFGKTFSVLFALRDEFIDSFEIEEVVNRYRNECLPLPVLLSMKNQQQSKQIADILSKQPITENEVESLLDLVMDSKETVALKEKMHSMVKEEEQKLAGIKIHKQELETLLQAMTEDI